MQEYRSRTSNAINNIVIGGGIQIFSLLVSFIARTVFIKLLNADYLGINGLFTNILTILSFSELGIGSAIIYNLYRPVAENNINRISALVNLYRKAYNYIALTVMVIGLLVIPIIPYLINGSTAIKENLTLIYILFLINTASSYLFSYRKSLFTVYQKDYINVFIDRTGAIIMHIIQLLYLYKTKNFYGYLIIQILLTISINLFIHQLSGVKHKAILANKHARLNKPEISKIFKDVSAIFTYKIGSIILTATDNIIISKMINLSSVGICSNYVLIVSSIESIISKALNGIVASIGNLNASDNDKSKLIVLEELTLVTNWLYGFCAIELGVLINEVIILWVGPDYIINNAGFVLSVVLSFYVFGSNFVASSYRTTMGYFQQAKFVPLIASILNIVLSIYLGKRIGLTGIFLATCIARALTFNTIDAILVIKKGLKGNLGKYLFYQLGFLMVVLLNVVICSWIIKQINMSGILGLTLKIGSVAIIANILFFIIYGHTDSFKRIVKRFAK